MEPITEPTTEPTTEPSTEPEPMVKPQKPRCAHCTKRLKMTELTMTCKCTKQFCFKHMNPHSHECSYDYVSYRRKIIEEHNPKMCIQDIEVK